MLQNQTNEYLHGFSEEEQMRLIAQNKVLSPDIYAWLDLSKSKHLLEIGCGVGAQMIEILKRFPEIKMTGIDLHEAQIIKAKELLGNSGINPTRYELITGNILDSLDIKNEFDDILLVWVLEHVKNPSELLRSGQQYLRKGGKIHITEVYNRSFDLYPASPKILSFWKRMDEFQNSLGGNGQIGIELGNLLCESGFTKIQTHSHPLFLTKQNPREGLPFKLLD
ncbi:MAG: methyltransferase [Saprospiraceae bacterium]|nr:methyltransferase [Saprospiraceae bacterium]